MTSPFDQTGLTATAERLVAAALAAGAMAATWARTPGPVHSCDTIGETGSRRSVRKSPWNIGVLSGA